MFVIAQLSFINKNGKCERKIKQIEDMAKIEVLDTGIGIGNGVRQRAFERFLGTIEIDSKPEVKTEIVIKLPLVGDVYGCN